MTTQLAFEQEDDEEVAEREAHARWLIAIACFDCGKYSDSPMLKNDIWDLTGLDRKKLLCLDCLEKRLGRMITLDDLNWSPASNSIRRLVERAKQGLL